MNREAFFAAIRPAFGNRLSPPQVAGIEAILNAAAAAGLSDAHHVANVLANVRRETGGYMSPIKETVMPYHKDQNPSDAEVIRRLDRAWAQGKLGKVKKPYWRTGEFGRGQIQVTHAENRAKFGITNRDDLLKLDVSARVAVEGMRDGVFRGLKLADFDFPAALDAPPAKNPRRIVNGRDGSDAEVAKFHRQFYAALVKAGWDEDAPAPVIEASPKPKAAAKPAQPAPAQRKPANPPRKGSAVTTDKGGGGTSVLTTIAAGGTGGGIIYAISAWWHEIKTTLAAWADVLIFWN